MSEEPDKDEKTLDPTPRRQKEFRDQGKVAVSRDLAGAIELAAVIAALFLVGNALLGGVSGLVAWTFNHAGDGGGQALSPGDVLATTLSALLFPTLALSGIVIVTTLAAYFVQTGFLFNFGNAAPKGSRLAPFKRLAEIFSPKTGTVKVLLTLAKLGLSGLAVTLTLASAMPALTALSLSSLATTTTTIADVLVQLLVVTVALLAVVAAVDYIVQRRRIAAEMRMTPQEVKKEMENEEGRPEIKMKRKQRHRELSLNRILKEVPTADVILTNPTHLAVALRYRAGEDRAPVVVAKGADELAALIRRLARQHNVPIIEHRGLARALYASVKVGRPIGGDHFMAVAEVLARVYRARKERRAGTQAR
jgi:flagellar biosynthetic protein FlhB